MNIEEMCCSLELATRLQELGVNQQSQFYYLNIDGKGKYYIYFDDYLPEDCEYEGEPISAFTAGELGELFPYFVYSSKYPDGTYVFYKEKSGLTKSYEFYEIFDGTEADCRAKMLIYLIENDLWKP